MQARATLAGLVAADEPSLRWKARVHVLAEDPESRNLRRLREEVRRAPRTRALLSRTLRLVKAGPIRRVYDKWQGAHWVLARLGDLGYPPADPLLRPVADQLLDFWLRPMFYAEFDPASPGRLDRHLAVPVLRGRARRCGSVQGNALLYLTQLGLDDGRCVRLVERLLHWQWPDGGWNCDLEPSADTSSFMETLLPMRGLTAYARARRSAPAKKAATRASEVFLRRGLFRRVTNGQVIRPDFVRLHYPVYWHYDILAGLGAMRELGRLGDPRCEEALDLLERARLPDGGWPAQARFYRVSTGRVSPSADWVDWGGTSRRRSNPWVTVEALAVLRVAGRVAL